MGQVDVAALEARISALERAQTVNETKNIAITDPNGVLRVEGGVNLPARGISAAQTGLRVSDGNGNVIWDSLGLIGVMQILTSYTANTWTSTQFNGGAGPPPADAPLTYANAAEVTLGTTGSFTLTRQSTVFGLLTVTAQAGAQFSDSRMPIYFRIGSSSPSPAAGLPGGGSGQSQVTSGVTTYQVLSLVAGTYTARAIWESRISSDILYVYAANLYIFQLGG